jgi:hypothetical protein
MAKRDPARPGSYLYGVTRARGWRRRGPKGFADQFQGVRFRDLEAVVRTVPFDLPGLGPSELEAHQRAVSWVIYRCTILPAPPGVVFSGRRALVKFLDGQYLSLIEGLVFLEGHWEFRLHIEPELAEAERGSSTGPEELYTELRRAARAAISFPRREGRLLSAAFLVEQRRWIDFVERTDDLGAGHPDLVLDLTGPWPPYDFVKLVA